MFCSSSELRRGDGDLGAYLGLGLRRSTAKVGGFGLFLGAAAATGGGLVGELALVAGIEAKSLMMISVGLGIRLAI